MSVLKETQNEEVKTAYKKRKNKKTQEIEFQFNAELIDSLSEVELENSLGNKYRIATLKFHLPNGTLTQETAMVYKKSYDQCDFTIGNKYKCTLSRKPDGNPAFLLSHLPASDGASAKDFASLWTEEAVE
jgi:hypothetical protein